jgi:hypothetical protein
MLLGLPLFFYLPGRLLEWLVFGARAPVRGLELHVMRVVASVLLCGWLGFLLAECGVWSLPALLGGLAVVLIPPLIFRLRRRHPGTKGSPAPFHLVAPIARPWPLSLGAQLRSIDLALLGVGLVFAVLVARPFEVVRGGLDAGVYALTGFSIARTGGIVIRDPLIAEIGQYAVAGDDIAENAMSNFLGTQNPVRYMATRLRASGFFLNPDDWSAGRIVPQFFHLWPVWIATGTAFGGPYAGLLTTGAWGLLGVVLLGLLGRRIAHPLVGVGAAAFLALNSVQVWFGRMPVSEALIQGLTLAGLWAYSHFADEPGGRKGVWWGALVGMAFGELALAKIDFFWAVGPALLLLLYAALSRRWRAGHTAMLLALAALLAHAALHVIFIARAYFFDTAYAPLGQVSALVEWLSLPFVTPRMREQLLARPGSALRHAWRLPLELAVLLAFIGLVAIIWRRPHVVRAVEGLLLRRQAALRMSLALVLGLLAVYAYVVRPRIVDAEMLRAPLSMTSRARLAGYVGAPIALPEGLKPTVARDQANFVRFGWYLSPLGILVGTVGAVTLWWRGLNRRTWLFLLIATAYTLFYVHALYGTEERTYVYILRRYVPLVYPAWSLAMAYGLWWLTLGRRWQLPRRVLATAAALLLLLFFVWTGRNMYAHVEYGGAIAQFQALADSLAPRDVVLVRGGGAGTLARDTPDIVAGPLTYLYGRNALTFKGANPIGAADALSKQVGRWKAEGREVYVLLSADGGDWRFPGWKAEVERDWTWSYREFQQLTEQKPSTAGLSTITFRLYRLVPASPAAPLEPPVVTPADTIAQAAGLHRAERDGATLFAWTTRQAILRLHLPQNGDTNTSLHLKLAPGRRPSALGAAEVCVDITPELLPYPDGKRDALPWQSLGCPQLGRAETDLLLPVPASLHAGEYLVRLSTKPWTPSNLAFPREEVQSSDARELGVRWLEAGFVGGKR